MKLENSRTVHGTANTRGKVNNNKSQRDKATSINGVSPSRDERANTIHRGLCRRAFAYAVQRQWEHQTQIGN